MGLFSDDPLDVFTSPPHNETPEERKAREIREAEAKRISDRIDEDLKLEKAALKKQKVVRVLLLGQAESGKSTTLKNFRMAYAHAEWKQERLGWRSVIQLNLIRSILTIVRALQAEANNEPIITPDMTRLAADIDAPDTEPEIETATAYEYEQLPEPSWSLTSFSSSAHAVAGLAGTSAGASSSAISSVPQIPLTEKHHMLVMRLGPLKSIEAELKRRLGAGTEEVRAEDGIDPSELSATPFDRPLRRTEFGIRRWHNVAELAPRVTGGTRIDGSAAAGVSPQRQGGEHMTHIAPMVDGATEVIATCREDVKILWLDRSVRDVLKKRKIRLEDSAGFFLDDVDRVATRDYEPSDDDILRARLRTLGVQEYKFHIVPDNKASDKARDWVMYDVGGARTLRHAWLPFFDNMNAIIFRESNVSSGLPIHANSSKPDLVAPVSAFDERLLEDPTVNRLEDSFMLWSAICQSKLLAKATFILFLNKCDLLKKKIKNGVNVGKYLSSFGDRPNDVNSVVKYLKDKFRDALHRLSPERRISFYYPTSVIDMKATAITLKAVRDGIMRENLREADFV
ncbi:hypothetical protein AMATHDRAFT_50812 [Amanita thiersii Skay4041]|uniref:G-alpha-domain-containing protein n=1 Tax=Amanita thiersii Skay4041 TaxID=703135 RepID=A0A2A9N8M7_9AGAR|nr:hypothetical protein AMATHDRAFT_50812 [Amanita thiersii Skay4041]